MHGLASAALFGAAALTTPRSFPFMLGFAVAAVAILPFVAPEARRHVWVQLAVCVVTGLSIVIAWTFVSVGGPRPWLRMMSFIASHEDTDLAIRPAKGRQLAFVWWQGVTFVSPPSVRRGRQPFAVTRHYTIAASFALVRSLDDAPRDNGAVQFHVLLRHLLRPALFAISSRCRRDVRRPPPRSRAARPGIADSFAAVRAGRVRAGVTWSARNPARLERFVKPYFPRAQR